jgi:filamentous hemagglutinin family protein
MKWYQQLILAVTLLLSAALHAEVVLDGTLGPAVALPGPNYQIEANLGQQYGNNLFHSFRDFNLDSTESATFDGPVGIKNIISRVTGGHSSSIDGLLQSKIPQADVYFINPAGISFGAHARLDVQGSFHASTADYLRLQDGSEFNAQQPTHSLLTVAEVSAFGFLNSSPAALTTTGSQLRVPTGKKLSLVGGTLQIEQGSALVAPSGGINLASMAFPGELSVQTSDLNLAAPTGIITITDESQISSSDFIAAGPGGEIAIRADQVNLINSFIDSKTYQGDGQKIDIRVNNLLIEGGQLTTSLHNFGNKGSDINILATDSVTLTGINQNRRPIQGSSILAEVKAGAQGEGGTINIKTGQLQLDDGAVISTITQGIGTAGNILIKATKGVFIAGESPIINPSSLLALTTASGNAGTIEIAAEQLILREGTQISTESFGKGSGGNITLQVKGLVSLSGLNSQQWGSVILANASGDMVDAGDGGTIRVTAGQLELQDGAQIATNTSGTGQGGLLDITANQAANFSGQDQSQDRSPSGLFTASESGATGKGGMLKLTARQLTLTDHAQINASSYSSSEAGQIQLQIWGEKLVMYDSAITTEAEQADGGDIQITTPGYLHLSQSKITTNVNQDFGHGGNITLKPELMVLNKSQITAQAKQGQGGHIKITTTGLYNFSSEPLTEIINAASEFGIDGEVTITTPEQDATEGMLVLTSHFSPSLQLSSPCSSLFTQQGSFAFKQLASSPPSPWDWKANRQLNLASTTFKPRKSSHLAAASVNTRVVSWKKAAEMKDSIANKALVIPNKMNSQLTFRLPAIRTCSLFSKPGVSW